MERAILYERINNRVDMMVENGLINEVKALIEKYKEFPTAMQAIGYKEIRDYCYRHYCNYKEYRF